MKVKKSREEIAELFMKGQDCGQVLMDRYAGDIGLSDDAANRISSTLGGGNGIGETCGAVIAALMVIGMKYGHNGAGDMERRDDMMARRAHFTDEWKRRRGSCMCNELLGDDITTPEGLGRILEAGTMFTLCPELVLEAMYILDEMMGISDM